DLNAAILYYEDAVNTLAQAGFKLRSWTSNNSQLREKFKQDNIQHDKPTTGVLGMNWKTDTDTLSYKPQIKRDAAEEKGTNIDNIVDINRYNTLAKLLRVTAFVLRFVNNIVGRQTTQQPNVSKVVSTSELHTAEQLWVRH
ncbi:hypothetical protein ScPMuIL_002168, partial [Solemya velum]